AAVAVARRAGANFVYAAINYFYGINEMTICTSTYWNVIIARKPGEIKKDEEGIKTMKNLGKNMAELLKATKK
ncbi:MAG: flavodoxin family protein, partial [Promethearchaeota archaeon]